MATTTTADILIYLESDEILNAAIAGLLDLGGGVVTLDKDYYCEQQHSNINNRKHDMQQTNNFATNISHNEDSSSNMGNDDSLYEEESVDGDGNDDYFLNDLDKETVH